MEKRDYTNCVGKTKALICVFVFAYAKSRFSHNEAHLISKCARFHCLLINFLLSPVLSPIIPIVKLAKTWELIGN